MDVVEIPFTQAKSVREVRELNSEALETQKRKLLCAIGKAELSLIEGDTGKANIERKGFLENVKIPNLHPVFPVRPYFTHKRRRRISAEQEEAIERRYEEALQRARIKAKNPFIDLLLKTDTIANIRAQVIVQEHSKFDIGHYLACVKAIYLMSGKRPGSPWENWEQNIGKAFTYILTHARLFGDQTQLMFKLVGKRFSSLDTWPMKSHKLPNTKYMTQITALINDLMTNYDETKYRILNANVTYFTLLILRRFVQDEVQFTSSFQQNSTQDDYMKLCPQALNCELPSMSQHFIRNMSNDKLNNVMYLAIYAYLTIKDATSKTILHATCLEKIEWHNMELPGLFFKVVSLYGLEITKLWDMLICEKTYNSLSRMANIYYNIHKQDTDETDRLSESESEEVAEAEKLKVTAWFPYCWATGEPDQEWPLSGYQNVYLCTILACIVDIKIGLKKSFIRNSDWAKNKTAKKTGLKIAEAFHRLQ